MTPITKLEAQVNAYTEISYEVADAVATIALNRPQRRNGYTVVMADELADALSVADLDDAVRVVILTGHGKDFCVGADLSGGALAASEAIPKCRDRIVHSILVSCSRRKDLRFSPKTLHHVNRHPRWGSRFKNVGKDLRVERQEYREHLGMRL